MLTPKQERFCQEYIIDLNATQAAIRAGYSKNGANVTASKLLSNTNIASRVRELNEKVSAKLEITAEYVLAGLKEVAERCLQRAPVMEWDPEAKAKVQATTVDGEGIWTFDSQGGNRAFELLGKHVGLFEKDNDQKKPIINVNVD